MHDWCSKFIVEWVCFCLQQCWDILGLCVLSLSQFIWWWNLMFESTATVVGIRFRMLLNGWMVAKVLGCWCLKSIGLSKVELHVQKAPWLLLSLFKGDTRSPKYSLYSQSWCRRGRARTLLPRALSMDDVKKLCVVATIRLNPCRHIFIKNCSIDWCSIVASSMGSVWSLASLSVQVDIYWFSWHSDVCISRHVVHHGAVRLQLWAVFSHCLESFWKKTCLQPDLPQLSASNLAS